MTTPETTDPEVLAAAREGVARAIAAEIARQDNGAWKLWDDLTIPHLDQGVVDFGLVADAAINEYRRSGSGVVDTAIFLLDRLSEFDPSDGSAANDFYGHVNPAIERLKAALAEPAAGEAAFQHRAKQAAKPKHSPLPEALSAADMTSDEKVWLDRMPKFAHSFASSEVEFFAELDKRAEPPAPNRAALIKRLRIKSAMIKMGEKIAYGSDSNLMDEAADFIAALRVPEAGWRTMDSAPKDGTQFLAFEKGRYFNCWWKVSHDEAYWMDEADSEPEPSMWMPLPPLSPSNGGK